MLRDRVIVTENDPSTAPIPLPTKQLSSAVKDNIPPSKSILLTIPQIPEGTAKTRTSTPAAGLFSP
ncbi:hypothetical protein VB005_11137 [Metarhizium brunneum]